jgi:WD40 repeat protein
MAAERRALLIATDSYGDPGLTRLRAPTGDVRGLAEVLGDRAIGGFDVRELVNRPTEVIKQGIEGFFRESRPKDVLLLYVSGHGVLSPRNRLFLATTSTVLEHLWATAVDEDFLAGVMHESRARSIVLVLDCCHSGAFAKGLTPKNAPAVDVAHRFEGQGQVTLTASTALEYAFEDNTDRSRDLGASAPGSLFTRFLVEGLRTGEADINQDGLISIDEAYVYVHRRVTERTAHQTPSRSAAGHGDIIVAQNPHRPTLPPDVLAALTSGLPTIREAGIAELIQMRSSANAAQRTAIDDALRRMVDDDSRRVSRVAQAALGAQPEPSTEHGQETQELVTPRRSPSAGRRAARASIGRGADVPRALPDYDHLEVRFTPERGDSYGVEIAAASGARARDRFVAPSAPDLERLRLTVDPRNRVRDRSRYLDAARQFGQGLFEALLEAASLRGVYRAAHRDARAAGRGLRVTLSLNAAPELAGIPWEFLYDRPRFLAQHVHTPVVRFLDLADTPSPLRVEPPLRILGVVSRPNDDVLATLDPDEEQAALERRLESLIDAGHVTIRWLDRATLRAVQREVDHGDEFHVFHYIGHGEYDAESGESSLILEDHDRQPNRVGGQQLGALLCDRGSLRLTVLNTCEAAQTAPEDPMAGVAISLMEYGVPAVVAMQFAMTDDGTLTFADALYGALAAGHSVDAAVTHGRRALAAHSDIEWGTPVLFMRVADGRLFDMTPAGSRETARAPSPPARAAPFERARAIARLTHNEFVTRVAFSPDGARLATSSGDKTACLWDTSRGRELARFTHDDWVTGLAFSPDGARLATACKNDARVWHIAGGIELARLAHDARVLAVAFSADGRRLATSTPSVARVWDVASRRELTGFRHEEGVLAVAFSPDGGRLATACTDERARVWDSVSGRELVSVTHDRYVTRVVFSPDGARLATSSGDKTARVWDSTTGRALARLTHDDEVTGVAFSPDGAQLATGSSDKTARVWDSTTGHELARLTHDDWVTDVAFSPDGALLATAISGTRKVESFPRGVYEMFFGTDPDASCHGYALLWSAE